MGYLTTGHLYYDRVGNKISMYDWGALKSDLEYCRVGFDTLEDGTTVSTVWLGLEHGVDDDGKPLIFETMSFDSTGNSDKCRRYHSEEEAKKGHEEMVLECSNSLRMSNL